VQVLNFFAEAVVAAVTTMFSIATMVDKDILSIVC